MFVGVLVTSCTQKVSFMLITSLSSQIPVVSNILASYLTEIYHSVLCFYKTRFGQD